MQKDSNSRLLVATHLPPSGNYKDEENQNCPNLPGGLSQTTGMSYLVPSCRCQQLATRYQTGQIKRHSELRFGALTVTPTFSWFFSHCDNSLCTPWPPTSLSQPEVQGHRPAALPSLSMPTFKHFMKRQAWQDLRRRFVISHSFVAGQLYSMLPETQGREEASHQMGKTQQMGASPGRGCLLSPSRKIK